MAKNTQFILFLLLITIIVATLSKGSLAGTVLPLVNKYHVNGPNTRSELLTRMLQKGNSNGPGTAPLVAGRYNGSVTRHYFAKIKMGTPEQELLMDIDTASDITWMNCLHNGKQVKQNPTGSIFDADNSTSFSEIQCGSSTCQDIPNSNYCGSSSFERRRTSGQNTSCGLSFSYRGATVGLVLANDTVTFDLTNWTKTQLRDVLVGCSDYSSDLDFAANGASGVLGLSYSNLSLRSKASESFGTNLSYCFRDPLTPINTSGYLIFGSHKDVDIPFDQEMQYTELVPAGDDGSYYGLNMKDVCVNSTCNILTNLTTKPLEFNSKGNGGVVVDTGSLVTLLVQEAYTPIIRAINASFVEFNITYEGPFDVCYMKKPESKFPDPKLTFVFRDGKKFAPHRESYVIFINETMSCLGFKNPGSSAYFSSAFGTMMQQRFFWELDLQNNILGFASSNCMVGS